MMKPKRPKVIKAKLEKELERYSKRIQKLASRAYQIRTMLEDIAAMEAANQQPEVTSAIHSGEGQTGTGSWTADSDTGTTQLFDNIVAASILPEQPEKLSGDQ